MDAKRGAAAADLDLTSGPVTSNLESVLQRHGIAIQAYHSRSFVGNHCSQYLKEAVYTDLYVAFQRKQHNSQKACRFAKMLRKFRKLTNLYSTVHRALSHSNAIPVSEIDVIQELIDNYLAFYRQNFPMKILP